MFLFLIELSPGKKEELKKVFSMFPKNDDRHQTAYESCRIEQAQRIMKPFFLRRKKTDVLKDLPDKVYRPVRVTGTFPPLG